MGYRADQEKRAEPENYFSKIPKSNNSRMVIFVNFRQLSSISLTNGGGKQGRWPNLD